MNILKKRTFILITAIVVVVLLVGGLGWYLYLNTIGGNAEQHQADEDKRVLEQLKKIILLPSNITPTMAIITNAELLKKNQPGFFADSQNGERLIIYPDLAIIFDSDSNKIIKVGGIQMTTPIQTPVTNPPATDSGTPAKAKTTK